MVCNRPRILMFAPLCYPPAGAEAIVTAKLLLAAIDDGWRIDVITQADIGHYYPVSSDDVWQPVVKVIRQISGFREGAVLDKLDGWSKGALTHIRSISWVMKAVLAGWYLTRSKKYDVILSRAAPQYGHLPALVLSRWLGIPWIANWSDPMPSCKAPFPYGQGPSAAIPFYFRNYYSGITYKADWHTFPGERLRKYFCSYFPQCSDKSSVIPHIALKRFRANVRKEEAQLTLCHAGGLGIRKPDIFLRGVRLFIDRAKDLSDFKVRFLGDSLEDVRDMTASLGLEGVVSVEDPKTYEETQEIVANATVSVVIEAVCQEGVFLPSKFVDFVQAGRPVLAVSPASGALSDILSTYGGGIAVDNTSVEAVAEAIESFYSAWKAGALEEKYFSSNLFHLFSEEVVMRQYRQLFDSVRLRVNA